jgi:hypothetical protein
VSQRLTVYRPRQARYSLELYVVVSVELDRVYRYGPQPHRLAHCRR